MKHPAFLVFLLGVALIALSYMHIPVRGADAAQLAQKEIVDGVKIIANCALLLGVISLLQTHWRKVRRRESGYGYSLVLYASFAAMLVAGFGYGIDAPKSPDETPSPGYWLFQHVKLPLESTIYSLLAFFIASAAYRAFRARSLDAVIMLAAAVIVMLGRIPLGALIPHPLPDHDPLLFEAGQWLMDVPTTAAKRAFIIGIGLSVVAASLRIILGYEKSYLGRSS